MLDGKVARARGDLDWVVGWTCAREEGSTITEFGTTEDNRRSQQHTESTLGRAVQSDVSLPT